jgi:chromosome segregation ATPase
MRRTSLILAAMAPALLLSGIARASSEEDQLREQLRQTVLQLRELQDNQAAASAQQAGATQQADALKKELAATKAKLRAANGGGRKVKELEDSLAKAKADTDQANQSLQQVQGQLAQYKDAYDKAAVQARDLTGERDRLQASLTKETAAYSACQAKNVQLYVISNQILDAYAKVSLGAVMVTREPFLGLKRVELENAVQDKGDKIYAAQCDLTPATQAGPAPVASAHP